MAPNNGEPPGWYRHENSERWWDGTGWTAHARSQSVPVGRGDPPPAQIFVPPPEAHAPAASRGRPVLIPGLIAAALLLVAGAPLEIGFYTFLRIAVTVAAIWIAIAAGRARQGVWVALSILLAITFNPMIPVWLYREVWIPIDGAGAVIMAMAAFMVRGPRAQR